MRPSLVSFTLTTLVVMGSACSPAHDCPADAPAITSFTVEPSTVSAGGSVQANLVVAGFDVETMDDDHGHMDEADGGMADEMCAGGHIHVYLDDLNTNPIAMEGSESFSITIPADTAAGPHTLIARLHNRDHTLVDPEVTAEASITVE